MFILLEFKLKAGAKIPHLFFFEQMNNTITKKKMAICEHYIASHIMFRIRIYKNNIKKVKILSEPQCHDVVHNFMFVANIITVVFVFNLVDIWLLTILHLFTKKDCTIRQSTFILQLIYNLHKNKSHCISRYRKIDNTILLFVLFFINAPFVYYYYMIKCFRGVLKVS